MKPFTTLNSIVAPLDRVDVDTDQIIPAQFLKRVERTGFGQFLFHKWRFEEDGSTNLDFELNQPRYLGSSILVSGRNFGSGSSREHAPWALLDYGFRCVIAPSFADIFTNNCLQNGILLVQLNERTVRHIINNALTGKGYELTVNLQTQRVWDQDKKIEAEFDIDEFSKYKLVNGRDDIDLTLQYEDKILDFEKSKTQLH